MPAKKQNTPKKKNVFVVGANDYNIDLMKRMPGGNQYNYIPILYKSDIQPPHGYFDFDDLFDRACTIIDEHGGEPDAIIGYYDFPVTSLLPLLNKKYKRPGAKPEAVAKLEHKYWMRLVEQEVFPDSTPSLAIINPFEPEQARKEALEYPFWLKPVMGYSSYLGFMIEDEQDLAHALHHCRQKIHHLGEPFSQFLRHVERDQSVRFINGNYAVAESLVSAEKQFTLEGYVHKGEVFIYGAVDSLREGQHQSSFSSYRYPSELPEEVLERGKEYIAKILNHIDFDESPFNVEFFWDPEKDILNLLEVNPRISKSHSPLFHMVDGSTQHKVAIDLSLGRKPDMPHRKGKDKMAAKYMLRSYEADGIIKQIPSAQEIERLERLFPDIDVCMLVEENTRLSSMIYQDSYSYELAEIFLGGTDAQMLEDTYARCIDSLTILIKPLQRAA